MGVTPSLSYYFVNFTEKVLRTKFITDVRLIKSRIRSYSLLFLPNTVNVNGAQEIFKIPDVIYYLHKHLCVYKIRVYQFWR